MPPAEFIALDTETTGLDTQRDRLLEVAAVRFVGGQPQETFESLVRYTGRVPLRVEKLTGIAPGDLAAAPQEKDVLTAFRDFVGDSPLVGHNVVFDQDVLGRALKKHSLPPLTPKAWDTLPFSSLLMPTLPSHKLGLVAAALGLRGENQHRALGDALTTGRLFVDLCGAVSRLSPPLRALLAALLTGHALGPLFRREGDELYLASPLPDLLAVVMGQRPWWRPPPIEDTPPTPPPLQAIWGHDGLLASRLKDYEDRPEQLTLAQAVQEALQTGGALAAEAGTGVGKSWAYLFPALLHALENGERVVVSTHTRQLQDQLFHKDLPTVTGLLGGDVAVGVVKGKGNYLCVEKLAAQLERAAPDNALALALCTAWAAQSDEGDLENFLPWAQLNVPQMAEVLGAVALDEHHPCRRFCAARPGCFLAVREEKLKRCQVLIVNHALLLTLLRGAGEGLDLENAVLVVDEAHHLEDVATQQLGSVLGQGLLGQLGRSINPAAAGSLPGRLSQALGQDDMTLLYAELSAAHTALAQATQALHGAVWSVGMQAEGLFQTIKRLWWDMPASARDPVQHALGLLGGALNQLHRVLGQWRHQQSLKEEGEDAASPALKIALAQALLVMGQAESLLKFVDDWLVMTPGEAIVPWVECVQTQQGGVWRLWRSPLGVEEELPRLLSPFKALVFTSATLAVGRRFDYFLDRTGLSQHLDHPLKTLLLPSPFDYQNNLRLYVPQAQVQRGKGAPHELEEQTSEVLKAIVGELGGGVLVLFNSIRELKSVAKKVRPQFEKDRRLLLAQFVDGTRQALSQEFRDDPAAVLFGTRSFFEGLDFKGDTLRVMVLTKLPFPFLKEPVIEARMKALKEQGRDPNREYYQPMAVFLLRQAVGRVIRSHTDRGVVFLLDERVITQSYGALFLDNIPPCPVDRGSLPDLLTQAKAFLEEKEMG